ncbi:replication factor RFC1 C terminal domain-containing protein [Lactarius akahatsu]|uniref:Replication factor C subunit 1 n=1 Tax=Lactarius akahatsu TaxID=416441 RepID=A0AAD4LT45_9AGAM|nr:replication factor RFC1 C terminal domain-containing protein [Lactarius akahatsu]
MSPPGKKSPGKKTNADSSQQDLRSFFGTGRAPTTGSKADSSQKAASQTQQIVISSEDEARPSPVKKVVRASESATRENSAIPTASLKRKAGRILLSSEDEDVEEAIPPPKKKPAVVPSPSRSREQVVQQRSKQSTSSQVNAKRKKKVGDYESSADEGTTHSDSDFMDVDEDEKVKTVANAKKKNTKSTNATPGKGRVDGKPKEDSRKVEPEKKDSGNPKPKFNWAAAKAARMTGPSNPGSKPVPPAAAPDCLAGLSFVFTGELSSFSREDAIDIAKRFCGRVVGQPSSKTDYVVLGDNAGPSKVAAIEKHNLKTLSEDEFLELIATRKGPGDGKGLSEKEKKKREKEEKAIRDSAKEMEARERATKAAGSKLVQGVKAVDPKTQLWTDRYAPRTMKEICGNKGQVEKLQQWLNDWSNSLNANFKKPGKNGMNNYRGVMITGPPGIGKTTSAHMCAKLAGFTPIELNASDARSKKLVENSTNIHNTSLDGWMGGGERTNAAGIIITDRSCLIMDEVDGMSAGDRGGVGALAALIRKTKVPIICIANDRSAPKMKPLVNGTFGLPFRKPDANQIRSRIMTIVFKEKMQIPANVIDELITGVGSDIRQVLNMLSTWKLHNDTMDYEEGKMLAKANEKYSVMTPFNIIQKILGPYMFSATSRDTLNDKIELYFHDYSFVPLFIQENYLKTNPSRVRDVEGPKKALKQLRLMEKAAESISDGDLVDSLIHGPEQHWSLMPTHAVLSTVRPSSFLYGPGSGYGGPNAMTFPQWLGQNSKQNKLSRALGDVQIRMRLKVSSDRSETRLSYLPAMFPLIVKPLMEMGSSAVDDVIGCMDDYYISREDWDTIVELGLGEQKDEVVLKKIATATKTALTRKYNSQDHPIPFHKAQDLGKVPKKLAGGPAPDLEEAFDVDDTLEDADDDKKGDDLDDIKHDKLIQEAKGKKKAAATKGKGAGKAKR